MVCYPEVQKKAQAEWDYPEPRIFKPEHFLKNGKLDNSIRNPFDIGFALGRR